MNLRVRTTRDLYRLLFKLGENRRILTRQTRGTDVTDEFIERYKREIRAVLK